MRMVGRSCCSGCGYLLDGRGQRGPGGGVGIAEWIGLLEEGEMGRYGDLPLVRQEIKDRQNKMKNALRSRNGNSIVL
jgi:hypothetical protein